MKESKKIFSVFLSLFLLISFWACKDSNIYEPEFLEQPASISEIQGVHHRSVFEGKEVYNIVGIVTQKYSDRYYNGFFMQSKISDDDPRSSEGIYVEAKWISYLLDDIEIGDEVSVSGRVAEIQFSSENPFELTITCIKATKIEIVKKAIGLDSLATIELTADKFPEKIRARGNINSELNIEKNQMDFFESLECMLVKIPKATVVGGNEKYSEIVVISENASIAKKSNHGGMLFKYGEDNAQCITLKGKFKKYRYTKNFTPNPNDKFEADITGIMGFEYGKYAVYTIGKLPKLIDSDTKPDILELTDDPAHCIRIASYNIQNFSIGDKKDGKKRLDPLAKQIKNVLGKPDIIGLVEVGDDNGCVKKKPKLTEASENLNSIVKKINETIADEANYKYAWLSINPEHGKDGGKPRLHVRNAILYNTVRVNLINENKGDNIRDTEWNTIENKLTFNPGRIGNSAECFEHSRKSLVAHLKVLGVDVFVVLNHLNSKRKDDPLYGVIQSPVRKSEIKRKKQCSFISKFLKSLYVANPNSLIVSMGDMNDFEFSPAIKIMESDFMYNSIEKLAESERHSYIHVGNSQALDHIFVNKEWKNKLSTDILNINSEFTKKQGRVSDHDPVVIQVKLF